MASIAATTTPNVARAGWISGGIRMTAAQRLYERLGFTRLPERDWSPVPGIDLIVYSREL